MLVAVQAIYNDAALRVLTALRPHSLRLQVTGQNLLPQVGRPRLSLWRQTATDAACLALKPPAVTHGTMSGNASIKY